MDDTQRDRIFGEWLAGHKAILFKVVHAYAFEHADRQDLFQEIFDNDPRTVWDFIIPIVGAAAALLWGGAMYVSHRAQALRERRNGTSCRASAGWTRC